MGFTRSDQVRELVPKGGPLKMAAPEAAPDWRRAKDTLPALRCEDFTD